MADAVPPGPGDAGPDGEIEHDSLEDRGEDAARDVAATPRARPAAPVEGTLSGPDRTPAAPVAALPEGVTISPRRRAARAALAARANTLDVFPEVTPRSPRAPRVTSTSASRPSLSGPDLRPIPRAPISTPRRDGAPAAPRPGAGIAYPMPGEDDDFSDAPPPPPPLGGVRLGKQPEAMPYPTSPMGRPPAAAQLSPRMTAIFGGLFGLATVTSVIALLIQQVPPRNERAIVSGSASAFSSASAAPSAKPEAVVKKRVRNVIPGPWRLSELEKESGIVIERGKMEKKSLFDVLGEKGIAKSEVYRIIKSLDGVRKFDKPKKKDRFAVAFERGTKKIRAFEYETSPSEVWQARAGDNGLLTGQKLDMKVGEEEYAGAFYVSKDVTSSFKAAGFEDGLLGALDEALAGHMSTEGFEEGGTVRVIAVEETALGNFSRYKRIVAMEYRPPDPAGKPVRIYTFNGQEAHGYWDDKGRQPNAGGWRSPCPGAPVTSPFNPKRLHPVLHTVMPHTGTDFGATSGSPIYSAYRGTVMSVGPAGPCGNTVQIQHSNDIITGYCHMSRFGNVKAGEKIGTHQLLGYVGATGRATGPHLHFFVKKNGQFVDSRTLHLDGDRPVPTIDRQAFLAAKSELDRRLEAIPLPDPPPPTEQPVAAAAPVASSGSAAADAPPEKGSKDAKEGSSGSSDGKLAKNGGRRAAQIGSPEALAAAKAEPGIHPSQFIESKGDEDEDDGPGNSLPQPEKGKDKPKGKPDPADDDDDDK
ncbi:Membrane protein related to metalloendopeptidase [Minicystis rosea]|nr:Membrane protein related to metalloendopeptidase [Minicystis rosea]